MSGIVKGIKKVFKKVVKVVKKVLPYAVAAAAIYFSAGLAGAAFAPGSFLATMPGIPAAASALGIGGAAAAGAATAAAPSLATVAAPSFSQAAGLILPATWTTSAGTAAIAPAVASGGKFATLIGKVFGGARSALGSMSMSEKLLLASMGSNVLSEMLGPTPREQARDIAIEQAKFRGAFYGMDESGASAPAPRRDLFAVARPPSVAMSPPSVAKPSVDQPLRGPGTQSFDLFDEQKPRSLYA
jgi:hypothetical protein